MFMYRPMRPIVLALLTLTLIFTFNAFLSLFYFIPNLFGQSHTTHHCPLCTFSPIHSPTSTRRDAILAASLSELKRVEYFLRTLRTTGTRARIILFLDNAKTASPGWRRFFKACDIEPVFIEHLNPVIHSAPKLSRYYFAQQWLRKHIDEVDRVIHTDTFDVIFQSDPFIPRFNASRLYFTLEPVTLGESHWTMEWMQQCYGRNAVKPFHDRRVSCSGVTAGGAKPFLKYLDTLLANPVWTSCFGHSLDQAHHNYMYYTGKFEEVGLEIEGLDCNSEFLTMHFCCKRAKCMIREDGFVIGNNTDVEPVLVHQYNRWKNLTNRNPALCPVPSAGLLSLTDGGEMAEMERLPPLVTAYPDKTLWPP
jgi:hypothetical protein